MRDENNKYKPLNQTERLRFNSYFKLHLFPTTFFLFWKMKALQYTIFGDFYSGFSVFLSGSLLNFQTGFRSLFETLPKNSVLIFKNLKIKNFFDKLFLKLQFWKLF